MISLDRVQGRDNNIFLIRIIAAFTVLFVHSQPLSGVDPYVDPVVPLGFTVGVFAVHIFFFTSGYFITGSLLSRNDMIEFAWARFMRIFPALWFMLLVTVVGLGLFVTTLPAAEFFSSPMTRDYVLRCGTLINGVRYQLPGVFEHNPFRYGVNGSLWTLPVEWKMYEFLAAGWMIFIFTPRWRTPAFRYGLPLITLVLMAIAAVSFEIDGVREDAQIGVAQFFLGSSLYVWRDRIKLSYARFALLIGAFCLAALDRRVFFIVYLLALGPLTLHLAYLFDGRIRNFNRLGDYSYGVYIFAFPIQQSLAALIPGISLSQMNIYASLLTLALAIVSWHFVEKPALDRKVAAAAATRRLFDRWRDRLAGWRGRTAIEDSAPPR